MISLKLLLVSFFWAGLALFIFELVWYHLEKRLDLLSKLPPELLEQTGLGYFISRFVMQFAFLVAVPSTVYSWFYVLLPFYGLRAGIGVAVSLFLLGIVPFAIWILMRIKLPLSYILFQMAGYLLKLILIYGIISYLYIL